jgi:type I restriction enzyme M protein
MASSILNNAQRIDIHGDKTMSVIQAILKDTSYGLDLFSKIELVNFTSQILTKEDKGIKKYYINCIIRNKEILLKPEEIVRQLYTTRLIAKYGYKKEQIRFEHPVHFGREVKSADIVIFEKDTHTSEYILVELKKPKILEGKNQLRSYCNATGAPIGVWCNGKQISYFNRRDPNYFEEITEIPTYHQTLDDIIKIPFTLKDLIIKDTLVEKNISLKELILQMEDDVLAGAGVDSFEEVFKLIFVKLYDEMKSQKDKDIIKWYTDNKIPAEKKKTYQDLLEALKEFDAKGFRFLEFRNTGQSDKELYDKINKLFKEAQNVWKNVFPANSIINLTPSHLSVCVSSLQNVKLFNSNLQIIDEAFEYLVNKYAKGEKGQYFTPRHVIDMCVKMLNPQPGESMIDPASGSCGFPVHTIFAITGHLFTNAEIPDNEKENIQKIFGIDFDERAVRVARMLNLIAGDGETNVLHMNSLDYDKWMQHNVSNDSWLLAYGNGFQRLEAYKKDTGFKEYLFDIVMANPPFAGDIKESRIIHKYDLGFNEKGKALSSVGRDVLFIERNLNLLKPGGRMAVVLPQGRFNNQTDQQIRNYIAERARILAVVGLHQNTFKPHTGTKTSVLFCQKWNDDPEAGPLCTKNDDYPIFFAVSEKGGKDNSGDYLYKLGENGSFLHDPFGHLIVSHDLHNHDGMLPDGVAEAFIDWAKSEHLSFWG